MQSFEFRGKQHVMF